MEKEQLSIQMVLEYKGNGKMGNNWNEKKNLI